MLFYLQRFSRSLYAKRTFDLFFSLLALLVTSPLFLLIPLLIKIDSKGPIFYKGKRLGKGGKIVSIYKFRTMKVGADRELASLLGKSPERKREWEIYQKFQRDPRCTSFGKWLRKTSLDEIPQFFCVLKGDLSIVGPRPHYPFVLSEKVEPFIHYASSVLSVKPGITSIWQVSGRSQRSYRSRVKLDSFYAKNRSLQYDFYLLLKTIPCVLFSKAAF